MAKRVIVSEAKEKRLRWLARMLGIVLAPLFLRCLLDAALEKLIAGGWRAGKSTVAALDMFGDIHESMLLGRADRFWIIGPDYPQCRAEFDYIATWAAKMGMLTAEPSKPKDGSWEMHLIGGIIVETKSAVNMEKLGSYPIRCILVVEAGQVDEQIQIWALGRVMESGGRIIYSGTMEDDDGGEPVWVWYPTNLSEWALDRTMLHSAYSLPSWANAQLFGHCQWIGAVRCPVPCDLPGEHGPLHGGEVHPQLRRLRTRYLAATGSDDTYQRRIAANPIGDRNRIYKTMESGMDVYLVDMPLEMFRWNYHWMRKAGGIDFGTIHPSALSWGGIDKDDDILWVAESFRDDTESVDWVWEKRAEIESTRGVYEWGHDPMMKYTPTYMNSEPMSGSNLMREARVGILQARFASGRIRFNRRCPGIATFDENGKLSGGLYFEMMHVRRKRNHAGELVYDRTADDQTASTEDLAAVIDGTPRLHIPPKTKIRPGNKVPSKVPSSRQDPRYYEKKYQRRGREFSQVM